jgi:anti-sigma factor RsiW
MRVREGAATDVDDMRCEQVVETITDYLDEVLPPVEMAALREHLSGCDGCSAYLDQIRRTIAAVRGGPETEAPDEHTEALDQRTEAALLDVFQRLVDMGGAGETR